MTVHPSISSSLAAAALLGASLALLFIWRVEAFKGIHHHHHVRCHHVRDVARNSRPQFPPWTLGVIDAAREQDDDTATFNSMDHQHSRRLFLLDASSSCLSIGTSYSLLTSVSMMTTGMVLLSSPPLAAWAAPPITADEANNLGARAKRLFRPKPPKILRPRLDKDFAILLMRSSYSVLDDLDCVAMDQFQRDFFLIRQAEYEPYVQELGVGFVKQGDLADPYYFDFISFAQYAAINREMTVDPPLVFEERQPVEVVGENDSDQQPQQFVSRIVRRDASITNAMLPRQHDQRVGMAILNRFQDVFGSTPKVGLPVSVSSRQQILPALQQLVKLFLINGFAFDGSAVQLLDDSQQGRRGDQFCLSLTSPATLWGTRSLQQEGNVLLNDFLLKTAKVLMERYGYRVVSSSVKYEGTRELSYLTIQ